MLVRMELTLLLRILLFFQSFQLSRFIACLFDTYTFSCIYVNYVLEGVILYTIDQIYSFLNIGILYILMSVFEKGIG